MLLKNLLFYVSYLKKEHNMFHLVLKALISVFFDNGFINHNKYHLNINDLQVIFQ